MTTLSTQDVVSSSESYRFIPIARGLFTAVSTARYETLNRGRWSVVKRRDGKCYVVRNIKGRIVPMTRFILRCPKGKVIDHWNGDTLDNRDCNLRIVSQQINSQNCSLSRNNTSGYTGVSKDKRSGKWEAYIGDDWGRESLGRYVLLEDAIKARRDAEKTKFGEVIRENCPALITDWPTAPMERPQRKNCTSGIVGVHFHRQSGMWMARLFGNKQTVYLGLHPTKEEAAAVIERNR